MRQEQRRSPLAGFVLGASWALALAGATVAPAMAQSSGSAIVDEALKDAEQEQTRDSDLVRRMVDEAVKGAETAPSGQDSVNPRAPDTLRPLTGDEPTVLPAGFAAKDLENQPVRDGAGARIGTVRSVVLDESTGLTRAMVEFEPLFGHPGKTSPLEIELLTPADQRGDGFVVELTPVAYESLPAYAWQQGRWRREGA
jgi:hypothetical protein